MLNFMWKKFKQSISVLFIFIKITGVRAESPTVITDPIAQAVFTTNTLNNSNDKKDMKRQEIGLVFHDIYNMGIVYDYHLGMNRYTWGELIHSSTHHELLPKQFTSTTEVAKVDMSQTSLFIIQAGMDQLFHIMQSKHWSFLIGLGAGLNRTEYQSKYYRQLCYFFCGFDPSTPFKKKETDFFAFIDKRIGIAFLNSQVGSIKSSFKLIFTSTLVRTGHFAFVGPDHREYKILSNSNFTDFQWVIEF